MEAQKIHLERINQMMEEIIQNLAYRNKKMKTIKEVQSYRGQCEQNQHMFNWSLRNTRGIIVSALICKPIVADNGPELMKKNRSQIQEDKLISSRINRYPQLDISLRNFGKPKYKEKY